MDLKELDRSKQGIAPNQLFFFLLMQILVWIVISFETLVLKILFYGLLTLLLYDFLEVKELSVLLYGPTRIHCSSLK